MRDHSPPPRLTRIALGLLAVVGFSAIYACSLIVESRDHQCDVDDDCVGLGITGATCNKTTGVCEKPTATGSGGNTSSSSGGPPGCDVDGGIDGGGCYGCPATTYPEILNECTDGCVPFDQTKVKQLKADGTLPDLPPCCPDGGM